LQAERTKREELERRLGDESKMPCDMRSPCPHERRLGEARAALEACVQSLNLISKEWGGGGRFKNWSHPENSLRMADAVLAERTEEK
jgi:hypothetical protein